MSNPMGNSLRTAAGKRAAGLVPVRLTPCVMDDHKRRMPDKLPEWMREGDAGTYWFDKATAQAFYDTARSLMGCAGLTLGTRAAYRALVVQLSKSPSIRTE